MDAIAKDKMPSPDFMDGVKCQAVLEAVTQSIEKKAWSKVDF